MTLFNKNQFNTTQFNSSGNPTVEGSFVSTTTTESFFSGEIIEANSFQSETTTQSSVIPSVIYRAPLKSQTTTQSTINPIIRVAGAFISETTTQSTVSGDIQIQGAFTSVTNTQSSISAYVRTYKYEPQKYEKSTPIFVYDRNERMQFMLTDDGIPYRGGINEELNGAERLEIEIPVGDPKLERIENEGRLVTRGPDGEFKEFIIRYIDDIYDDNGSFKIVKAESGEYELIDEFLPEYTQASVDLKTALTAVLQGTRISVGDVEYMGQKPVSLKNMSVKNAVYELLNIFGAERIYRVNLKGNRIIHRHIDAVENRGRTKGKRWTAGRDILKAQRVLDSASVKTALYGRGAGQENDGPRLTFAKIEWSKANGDPADKPLGQTWVGDEEALQQWGYNNGKRHKFSMYDGQEEDPAELLLNTWNELQRIKSLNQTYEVDVIDLAQQMDVPIEEVRLGDVGYVSVKDVYPAIDTEAAIIGYYHDLNDRRLSKATLGQFRATYDIGERVHNTQKDVNDKQGNWDKKPTHDEVQQEAQNKADKALVEAQKRIDAAKLELEQSMVDFNEAMQIADNVFENKILNPKNYKGYFTGDVGITGELHVAGTIIGGNGATIRGTLNAQLLNLQKANIIDANIQNATITGTLSSVDGTFVGDLVGARIYSSGTTFVGTDLRVTNNIYLGSSTSGTDKKISFNTYSEINASGVIGGVGISLDSSDGAWIGAFGGEEKLYFGTSPDWVIYKDLSGTTSTRNRLKLEAGGTAIWIDPNNGTVYFLYNGQAVHKLYGNGDWWHSGNQAPA
ncbi:phage tail protein [Virgibacillus halodenitrificans]|uniref:phage tail spike protein n=1 Tax=Virgibacillus halodenitrificans TaxID=1482 RepID=UPI001F1D5EB1|nr:phage tail spike protein [Virgibacillus halodenitrificans]MCG1029323.1 phage tail protein [Virgibacillus halodenitrificans]